MLNSFGGTGILDEYLLGVLTRWNTLTFIAGKHVLIYFGCNLQVTALIGSRENLRLSPSPSFEVNFYSCLDLMEYVS